MDNLIRPSGKVLAWSFALLVVVTAAIVLIGQACLHRTWQVLPVEDKFQPWRAVAASDGDYDGSSTVSVGTQNELVEWHYSLDPANRKAYASVAFEFLDAIEHEWYADLSFAQRLKFTARCQTEDVLNVTLHEFVEGFTNPNDWLSFRSPTSLFACSTEWQDYSIDLGRLRIPDWWLASHGLRLSDQSYTLEQVRDLQFSVSPQSPAGVATAMHINTLYFEGDRVWVWWAMILLPAALWNAFVVWLLAAWFTRKHARAAIEVQNEMPSFNAGPGDGKRSLHSGAVRDKEKTQLLDFLATEYANAQLSLEGVVAQLKINRNKVNELLREETGLTFSSYLNKLRLTQAAELLATESAMNVTQVGYSVGYNNISYFNRLFKTEFGCTPKEYRESRGVAAEQEHGL